MPPVVSLQKFPQSILLYYVVRRYSGGKNKLNTILHKIGKSAVAQSKLWIKK